MSKVLRAQTSIIFDDVEMYNNFIKPLQSNKELNSFILKLLTLYYHNNEVRNLIDASSVDSDSEASAIGDDYIQNVRNSFFVMNSFIESAQGSIAEGIKKMESFTGGLDNVNTDSDFGSPILNLNVPKTTVDAPNIEDSSNKDSIYSEVKDLKNELSELKEMFNKFFNSSISHVEQSRVSSTNSYSNPAIKEDSVVEQVKQQVTPEPVVSKEEVYNEPISNQKPEEEEIDGQGLLSSLVSSLNL